ncbi:Alpha/Beta hydrolase protein [Fennellomyces sp. T-0311]|nr:Alpha/Beta hydrolase protein [Fennellomyces sp. T-0311]
MRTVYVSASLFFLPVLAICFVLCLPLVVLLTANLYICAWAAYLYQHRRTAPSWTHLLRHLPCLPSTVIRMNAGLLHVAMTYIRHIPTYLAYFKWRYWTVRSRFHRIVRRRIVYSKADPKTCQLDVYYPDILVPATPMIVFIHGSSLPSHRTFYTLFANTLRELGYMVAVPDFTNEKQVRLAIKWAYRHACERQLDPEMIYVLGHGTGAHTAIQVVLNDVLNKAKCYTNPLPSSGSDNSGKHDPSAASDKSADDHLHDFLPQVEGLLLFAGVYRDGGESAPLQLIKENHQLFETSRDLIDFFPRILFVHGNKDDTASDEESIAMYSALGDVLPPDRREEVDVRMRLYKQLNHTQCITALMPSLGSYDRMNKLLSRDIKEFVDPPSSEE